MKNFTSASSAIVSSPAKAAKITNEQEAIDAGFRFKADPTPPSGSALMFAYTVGLLGMLGALTGSSFKAKALSGMYGSATVITHHVKKGNMVREAGSMVRLTQAGLNHFNGRELGKINGQRIDAKDARCMGIAAKAGPKSKVAQESSAVRQITWRKVGAIK